MRALALALLATASASAQPGWWRAPTPGPDRPTVALDVLVPTESVRFDLFDDQGQPLGTGRVEAPTVALALSGRISVSPRVWVEAEIPVAVTSLSEGRRIGIEEPESTTGTDLGNPYLGVAWAAARRPGRTVTVEGGLRLPLHSADPDEFYLVDLSSFTWDRAAPEHREAFLSDLLTVRGAVRLRQSVAPGVGVELSVAPALGVSTREVALSQDPDETERRRPTYGYVAYRLGGTAAVGPATVALALVGGERIAAVDDVRLPASTAAVAGVAVRLGRVRPQVGARLPIRTAFAEPVVQAGLAVDL